jgi:FkbH-like protein
MKKNSQIIKLKRYSRGMKDIKLVIWDLDDTFWEGTLSEGKVKVNSENIEIVKELVDRGIMNSIVSKNDYERAKGMLEDIGVFKYFIFPQISWNPKGEIVKQLLKKCGLRAENTLFVDDNPSNIEEVKFYNPGINAELPAFMSKVTLLEKVEFLGKNDKNHSRLQQYKNLEQRSIQRELYSSNVDFLKKSQITITCDTNCLQYEERLYELLHRTNQLNFTKVRTKKEEFHQLLLSKTGTQQFCIKAKDTFGDYGLTGFVFLKDNQLIHFLFSCRILGLGIEKYIYNKLGRPNIKIQEEVAIDLFDGAEKVDWINETDKFQKNNIVPKKKDKIKLLMIGGCDLEQAAFYLDTSFEVRKEFATQRDGINFKSSDSIQLLNSFSLSDSVKKELLDNIPFYHKDITFETKMFSGDHDIVIWSVVDDYIRGVYKHNTADCYVSYAGYFDQEEYLSRFKESELKYLHDNFTFVGRVTSSQFESNVRSIVSNLKEKTTLLLINGAEVDVADWIGTERCQRQLEMNAVADKIVSEYNNVQLVDMRVIVKDKSVLTKNDNRHFNRAVYHEMATAIVTIIKKINSDVDVEVLNKRKEIKQRAIAKYYAICKKLKRYFNSEVSG